MKNSKTIQTCENIAKAYTDEMNNIFSTLRGETLRGKLHNFKK